MAACQPSLKVCGRYDKVDGISQVICSVGIIESVDKSLTVSPGYMLAPMGIYFIKTFKFILQTIIQKTHVV